MNTIYRKRAEGWTAQDEYLRKAAMKAGYFGVRPANERNRRLAKREIYRALVNCELIKAQATIKAMIIVKHFANNP